MRRDFHVQRGASENWIVVSQAGAPLLGFRRLNVAVAYGKALAHHAKVALVVHRQGEPCVRFSGGELTYSPHLC